MKKTLRKSMFVHRLLLVLALFLVSMALAACASTGLVNMWHDPSFQQAPLNNMLIIAMKKDPVKRRMWEDGFASEFGKRGMTVCTYPQF